MSMLCVRMFGLFACVAALAFGQSVRLIEGIRGDIVSSKQITRERVSVVGQILPNDVLIGFQKPMFEQTGMVRAWQKRGLAISLPLQDIPIIYMGTGIDTDHPDLIGRVDCSASETFIEDGGDPCVDEWGHETGVAIIGSGTGNDSRGVAGYNWSSRIISYKVMTAVTDQYGRKTLQTSLDAIIKAFRKVSTLPDQLVIVNTSFSIDGVSPTLIALLHKLEEEGKVFVVSATDNIPLDSASLPGLPCAASNLRNVLCVGSLSSAGNLSAFSAYGEKVNYTGRCENLVTGYPQARYGYFAGNSGCAPQVSATAVLVASYATSRNWQMTASELKMIMMKGGAFAPGLISAIRQQTIKYPVTLDVELAFDAVDRDLENTSAIPLNERSSQVMTAAPLVVFEGDPTNLRPGIYKVRGENFSDKTIVFVNALSLRLRVVSPKELEIEVGDEISLFRNNGYNNVLFLAERRENGDVDPFTVVPILSGFGIQLPF